MMEKYIVHLLQIKGWRAVLLLLGLGALSAITFPPIYFVPILAITFPALLCRLDRASGWRAAFVESYLFGFGLHSVALYWLINAILIRAADFWWLVPIVSPLCALLLALWTGIAGGLYYWFSPKKGWVRIFVFAGLWTICDMSRAILLPSAWWNPILTGFPWNPLGSSWEIPGLVGDILIQPAAWIGVDGLTLLTVLLVLTPVCGKKGFISAGIGLTAWVCFGLIRLGPVPKATTDTPIVALIQGNIAENDKIENVDPRSIFQSYLRLTTQGMNQAYLLRERIHQILRPIVFAWPESSFPGNLQIDQPAREMIMQSGLGATVGMIGAITEDSKGRIYNSVVALSPPIGMIEVQYDKTKLVPFGESQPFIIPFHVVPGMELTPGNGVKTFHIPGISPFGALICYEVIFSGQIIDHHDRPKWLLNITNDGWYGNSAGPRQHLASVRLRAVEEGLPIVRVANTGISAVFDPYGRETAQIAWGKREAKAVALSSPLPPPLFAVAGRFIPLFLAIAALLLVVPNQLNFLKNFSKKKE